MFNPNDIFISIAGFSRLTHLCFNLELYNNFSFRNNLYINVVYNGEYNLKELININNLSCDNVVMLTGNEGVYRGALDGINASLKSFIESDKSIGVIHNFDFLFFYDSPFKMMITDLLKSGKSFLGWIGKKTHPPEKAIYETDCFVITKEFARQIYPIEPEKDKSIFYRTILHTEGVEESEIEVMEEWLFRRLIKVIMPNDIEELNNPRRRDKIPQQHIVRDHNKVISALDQYCFSNQVVSERQYGDDHFFIDYKEYYFKYQCVHTHSSQILKALFMMYRYNVGYNEKFKIIDRFINNEVFLTG